MNLKNFEDLRHSSTRFKIEQGNSISALRWRSSAKERLADSWDHIWPAEPKKVTHVFPFLGMSMEQCSLALNGRVCRGLLLLARKYLLALRGRGKRHEAVLFVRQRTSGVRFGSKAVVRATNPSPGARVRRVQSVDEGLLVLVPQRSGSHEDIEHMFNRFARKGETRSTWPKVE